jgi:predicted transcriptional regulator
MQWQWYSFPKLCFARTQMETVTAGFIRLKEASTVRASQNYLTKMKYRSSVEILFDICKTIADSEVPLSQFDITRLTGSKPADTVKFIVEARFKGLVTSEFGKIVITTKGIRFVSLFTKLRSFVPELSVSRI